MPSIHGMTTFGQVFAVPRFRVLFAGQALLVAGDTVRMLAFSVLVYARTGSPGLQSAGVMTAQALGAMLVGALAEVVPAHHAIAWAGAAAIGCAPALRATVLRPRGRVAGSPPIPAR